MEDDINYFGKLKTTYIFQTNGREHQFFKEIIKTNGKQLYFFVKLNLSLAQLSLSLFVTTDGNPKRLIWLWAHAGAKYP